MPSWGELLPHLEQAKTTCLVCGHEVKKPSCMPHESKARLDYSCPQCGLEFRLYFDLNAFGIAVRQKKGGK